MKKFKVKVQDKRADFFMELLDSLDFVEYEEVDGFHEPRVYPGANFEIRSKNAPAESPPEKVNYQLNNGSADGLDGIRQVLSRIDAQRSHKKD